MGESPQHVQPGSGLCVYARNVFGKGHPPVEGHSKEGGCWGVWNRSVIESNCGLCCIFPIPWGDECDGRFGG